MTNHDVAAILSEIADLMEIADENAFKVRAYRRAAETISGLGEDIANLHAEGALESIPGVGKGLAEKIAQFIETGQIDAHSHLLAQFPESILEMLGVPGFGPKKAGLVYRELGIGTVDELEQAAREGRLRGLKGMGAKTEEKLLRGIAIHREGRERTLLGAALPIAQMLVEELRARTDVIQAQIAGSARRGRETIGDLDILATSQNPDAVCRAFADGKDVIVAGDTKVSVRTPQGINIDLRVVPPESYGAALMYFTGSKHHNIELRERAGAAGLTLNEYGLFDQTDEGAGGLVAGRAEQDVYDALGLAWIPPELREATGEIQAAAARAIPTLIQRPDIRADLHMHTVGSDGRNTIAEMMEHCRAAGHQYMGVTDHSPSLTVAGGQSRDELLGQVDAVRMMNQELSASGIDFTVLAGIEADILGEGRLDIPDGCFEELDFVIGAIHQGFTNDADRMTARIIAALQTGRVDILAHPTGRLLLERDAYGIHIDDIIAAAVENDVALEINAFPQRLDLGAAHARSAASRGAKLCINTDSHDVAHLAFMALGVVTARRGWVEAHSVINTWPIEELRAWLKSRRG